MRMRYYTSFSLTNCCPHSRLDYLTHSLLSAKASITRVHQNTYADTQEEPQPQHSSANWIALLKTIAARRRGYCQFRKITSAGATRRVVMAFKASACTTRRQVVSTTQRIVTATRSHIRTYTSNVSRRFANALCIGPHDPSANMFIFHCILPLALSCCLQIGFVCFILLPGLLLFAFSSPFSFCAFCLLERLVGLA